MKKNEIKRMLAESLPYPNLTIRADRRFDAVCGMLEGQPERRAGKASAPAHWNRGETPRAAETEAVESVKGRHGRTALKVSVSLAALVLVSLLTVNLAFPAAPDRFGSGRPVPGAAGNSDPQEDPAVNPGPESSQESSQAQMSRDSIALDSWEREGTGLRAVFTYPVWQDSVLSKQMRSTLTVEAALPDGTRLDMEIPWSEHPELGSLEAGETVTAPYDFTGLPEEAESVVLTVYSWSPDVTMLMTDDSEKGAMVLAEFTLDLAAGKAEPTEHFRKKGYESMSPADCAGMLSGELQFEEHVFRASFSSGFGKLSVPGSTEEQESEDPGPHNWETHFYCDTLEELPYEVRFFIDGELYQAVPLSQKEGAVETDEGYLISLEDYGIEVQQRGKAEGIETLRDSIQSIYMARVYLSDELYETLVLNPEIYPYSADRVPVSCQIVNTETERVLYDSSISRQEQKPEVGEEVPEQ